MACAVGLAAQQTTGTTGASEQSGQARSRTVTGCLRAGDTAGTYMLTDLQMGSTAGTTAGGGTGTTGTGATATGGGMAAGGGGGQMPTSLMLSPASSVDLKAHIGHKVEVTGTMQGAHPAGDTTTGTTGAGATGGGATGGGEAGQTAAGGSQHPRTMDVSSVRMVSESCS
jgi:hypothetical protein